MGLVCLGHFFRRNNAGKTKERNFDSSAEFITSRSEDNESERKGFRQNCEDIYRARINGNSLGTLRAIPARDFLVNGFTGRHLRLWL